MNILREMVMAKKLRKGVAKYLLLNSIESATTAVEIYNKPKAQFKIQTYITLMIIAWTKAFHSYFYTKNIKFYYKKDGVYVTTDGEYKTWDITECLRQFDGLDDAVKNNIKFFIGFRNKVEHRDLSDTDIEMITIGECQSLLYNYESFIVDNFGEEYAINESLSFALQFSTVRTNEQKKAQKRQLSKEVMDIKHYVDKFRSSLTEEVFNSQKYSIKFLIIPKISNNKSGDLSIEFVKEDSLSEEDYNKITAVIKDKKVVTEAVNVKRYKPSKVIQILRRTLNLDESIKLTASHHHPLLCRYYKVRPFGESESPFDTKTEYCLYDDTHTDYVYTAEWIKFLSSELKENTKQKLDEMRRSLK